MSDWRHYGGKPRIEVEGGIRSQGEGDGLGWWARRWLSGVEGTVQRARLARGRAYARKGQVVSIDFAEGRVSASVQGSDPRPYRVTIELAPLTPEARGRVLLALSSDMSLVARLMAGDLPQELEAVFAGANAALLPGLGNDFRLACSCPDLASVCKHTVAVCFLVAEELDRDPFLLLRLRGMEREGIPAQFAPSGVEAEASPAADETPVSPPGSEPIDPDPALFWQGRPIPPGLLAVTALPRGVRSAAHQLGPFPLWRGWVAPAAYTDSACRAASMEACALWSGEPPARELDGERD